MKVEIDLRVVEFFKAVNKKDSAKASMKKTPKTLSIAQLKSELFKSNKFVAAYENQASEFQIAKQLIDARLKRNLTQAQLAEKIDTGQAVISRLEGLNAKPSLALLERLAKALDTQFQLTIG